MDKIFSTLKIPMPPEFDYEADDEIDRQVQENLQRWQAGDKPLAPLSDKALDVIYKERERVQKKYFTPKEVPKEEKKADGSISSLSDFIDRLMDVEAEIEDEKNYEYKEHSKYLDVQYNESSLLCDEVGNIVGDLGKLQDMYKQVTMKTSNLHILSEQLMKHQAQLKRKKEEINERLKYFTLYNGLHTKITSRPTNVNSDDFIGTLDQINNALDYLAKHPEYKESYTYKLRYEHLLVGLLHTSLNMVNGIITDATNQVINIDLKTNLVIMDNTKSEPSVDTAFSFYYGKFQNASKKVSKILNYIEDHSSNDMYLKTLDDVHNSYFLRRAPVMQAAVFKALTDLRDKYKTDFSILFRSAGLFIIKVCQDETACYNYFFKNSSQQLSSYLSSLCQYLYDTLRPCLISINHLEVLTELCTILKEMINDQVQNNPSLDQFVEIIRQLLQDVEERLVFRTNIFFQYDLSAYEPSPGDLAYPEKLEQMENISEELAERAHSRSSSVSMESQEVAQINASAVGQFRSYTGNSPADLHGMWYPTVKRTLVCLSRLYLCLDREIFQGVAHEALIICAQTIDKAAEKITARKTSLDGRLFQVKHLLIVREQIAPFQVDFTVKEVGLDFSHVKSAAVGLMHNRNKIFSMNSNNALLEFLLEGTPRVKEYLVDSRKEIDKQLKSSCEAFIANTTNILIGNLLQWLQKAEHVQKLSDTYKENAVALRDQESMKPQILAGIITIAQRNIKTKIPEIQRSMRLYLANRETEFILFRPIKNNVINAFIQLDQLLLAAKYTPEDQLLIACPTPEQLNILICSVSLAAEQDHPVLMRSASRHSDKGKH